MANEHFNIPGVLDRGTRITSIKFAGTVLTFQSDLVLMSPKSFYQPVYVHHVVLIPLNHASIGMASTKPFVPAHCLVSGLSTAYSGNSAVSVSIINCLKWDQYEGEIKFRRMYGIRANLNRFLVRKKVLPHAIKFTRYDENVITYNCHTLVMYKCDIDNAYKAWENKLVLDMEQICMHFEPVYIG